jgi:hypothetical protein
VKTVETRAGSLLSPTKPVIAVEGESQTNSKFRTVLTEVWNADGWMPVIRDLR